MPFLYGDSTPSALETNYIDFLRDALDFSARVLGADERLRGSSARADELRRATEIDVARLESFGDAVSRAVVAAMSAAGGADSPVTRCAQSVVRSSSELVSAAIDRVRADASAEIAQHVSRAERDQGGALQALGTLLLRHDLPDATTEIRVTLEGARYAARLHVHALDDLVAVVELGIADDHVLSHPVRVDKVVERLEVHAPEISGWLRKEVKLKPQRLDKEYVTSLVVSGTETVIALRSSADGVGPGYDVVVRKAPPLTSLTRVGEGAELPSFDLTDEDETRMVAFEEALVAAAVALMDARKSLAEATLGGMPLAEHPAPRAMVERLVEKMAPVVREIARHSLSPNELVLKRLLDNGRREEIFVSRQELEQKFEGLGDQWRALFVTLGLADGPRLALVTQPEQPTSVPEIVPAPVVVPTAVVVPAAVTLPARTEEVVAASPVASQPPPASVPKVAAATGSQRPSPPRPGSVAPPRPSNAPAAPASAIAEDDWGNGKA
jgi:hypothetical protein